MNKLLLLLFFSLPITIIQQPLPTGKLVTKQFGTVSVYYPDQVLTPGDVDPTLTKNIICNPNWHTNQVRKVTESEKEKVYAEYGLVADQGIFSKTAPYCGAEVDHLISLELAGTNSITNLWPQSYCPSNTPNAHTKDLLENKLHKMVCEGTISLQDAQTAIKDWYPAYLKYVVK